MNSLAVDFEVFEPQDLWVYWIRFGIVLTPLSIGWLLTNIVQRLWIRVQDSLIQPNPSRHNKALTLLIQKNVQKKPSIDKESASTDLIYELDSYELICDEWNETWNYQVFIILI